MPWGPLPPYRGGAPTRGGSYLDITIIGGLSIGGDIISDNWDGSRPINLATVDTITTGYAIDASAGAMQIWGPLFVGTATSHTQIKGSDSGNIFFHDEHNLAIPSGDGNILQGVVDQGGSVYTGTLSISGYDWPARDTTWLHFFTQNTADVSSVSMGVGALSNTLLGAGQTAAFSGDKAFAGADFVPLTDSAHELGNTALRWSDAYIDNIHGLDWKAWTPTYANLTVGNGSVTARYVQIGKFVACHFTIIFGTTSVMGTAPTISTPVTASSTMTVVNNWIGGALILDAGTANLHGKVRLQTTTTFAPVVLIASGNFMADSNLTATNPMTWTTSDSLSFTAIYEAA